MNFFKILLIMDGAIVGGTLFYFILSPTPQQQTPSLPAIRTTNTTLPAAISLNNKLVGSQIYGRATLQDADVVGRSARRRHRTTPLSFIFFFCCNKPLAMYISLL